MLNKAKNECSKWKIQFLFIDLNFLLTLSEWKNFMNWGKKKKHINNQIDHENLCRMLTFV